LRRERPVDRRSSGIVQAVRCRRCHKRHTTASTQMAQATTRTSFEPEASDVLSAPPGDASCSSFGAPAWSTEGLLLGLLRRRSLVNGTSARGGGGGGRHDERAQARPRSCRWRGPGSRVTPRLQGDGRCLGGFTRRSDSRR
jgi:hypothetical protein